MREMWLSDRITRRGMLSAAGCAGAGIVLPRQAMAADGAKPDPAIPEIADDRESSERTFWNKNPCMKNCRDVPKITGRAGETNITPDAKSAPKVD